MAHIEPVCGCDCARGDFIILRLDEPDDSRCQCPLCGVPGEGTGCTVLLSPLAKFFGLIKRDKSCMSEEEFAQTPLLCDRCLDHAVLVSRREAVKRMQGKRKRGENVKKAEADGSAKAKTKAT